MNKLKKIISIVCIALLVSLNFTSLVSADNLKVNNVGINYAATVSIVSHSDKSRSSSANISGHSFLIVKNVSSTSITVAKMKVAKGGSVTLGTFGNRKTHKGIWYNIEGYCTTDTR